jgi:hypothetical protein
VRVELKIFSLQALSVVTQSAKGTQGIIRIKIGGDALALEPFSGFDTTLAPDERDNYGLHCPSLNVGFIKALGDVLGISNRGLTIKDGGAIRPGMVQRIQEATLIPGAVSHSSHVNWIAGATESGHPLAKKVF